MKKIIAMMLAVIMVLSLAACGGNKPVASQETKKLEGTMEELLNKVIEIQPVEFMGGVMPIDLADTSEDGLWMIYNFTGLDSAEGLTEAAAFEPMMGSLPYSMVMVRVAEGTDAKTVAEAMKAGIDPRKWICVEADDLQVVGFGDVVMLIMVGSETGMTSQSFVDAFKSVAGAELDFAI